MWIYIIIASINCYMIGTIAESCRDTITKTQPYIFVIGTHSISVTSCSTLVKEYSSVCRNETIAKKICCLQCKNIKDLSCVDGLQRPGTAYRYAEQFVSCPEYIRTDPCRCDSQDVKNLCCYSCKKINTVAKDCTCRNIFNLNLRPAYRIGITISYKLNNAVTTFINSCKDFLRWYPSFCHGPKFYKIQNMCCKTCKNVKLPCVDNVLWTATVSLRNKVPCHDCNCHDIRKKSRALMKHVCSANVKGTSTAVPGKQLEVGARKACCYQCYRLGFEVPQDYSEDTNRVVRADIHFISSVFNRLFTKK